MKRRGIQSLENRVRYTITEIRNKLEQISSMENELEVLQSELHNIQVSCSCVEILKSLNFDSFLNSFKQSFFVNFSLDILAPN